AASLTPLRAGNKAAFLSNDHRKTRLHAPEVSVPMRISRTESVRRILALALALVGAGGQAQGIYRYVEKDGTIVYTNVPPSGRKSQKLSGQFKAAPAASDPVPQARSADDVRKRFDELMNAASIRYRIPLALVRAIVHAESNYDPTAVSPRGASGLMQL